MGRRRNLFPLLVFGIVLITALIAVVFITNPDGLVFPDTAVTGMGYTRTSDIPLLFAPPFDELDGIPYVIATAAPDGDAARVTVRVEKSSSLVEKQYIYKHGYFSRNNQFERFTFPDATIGGSNWILDNAHYSATITGLKDEEYVIVYVCKKYAGETGHVCGPRGNPPVETKKWTIESFTAPLPTCESRSNQFCLTSLTATQLGGKNMSANSSFRCAVGKTCYQCDDGFINASTHCIAGCDATNACPNNGALRCGADGRTIQECTPANGCLKWGPALSCEQAGFGTGTICDGGSPATCTAPTCTGPDRFCGTPNANTTSSTGTCLVGSCISCKSGFVNESGMCKQQCTAQNCNGAYSCSGNACICNGCTINGACIADGTTNVANSCQVCSKAASSTSWTTKPASSVCTASNGASGTCSGSTCVQACDGCLISGTCHPQGTQNPVNSCQVCNTALSTNAWSAKTNGAACTTTGGASGTCQSGSCTETICALLDPASPPTGLTCSSCSQTAKTVLSINGINRFRKSSSDSTIVSYTMCCAQAGQCADLAYDVFTQKKLPSCSSSGTVLTPGNGNTYACQNGNWQCSGTSCPCTTDSQCANGATCQSGFCKLPDCTGVTGQFCRSSQPLNAEARTGFRCTSGSCYGCSAGYAWSGTACVQNCQSDAGCSSSTVNSKRCSASVPQTCTQVQTGCYKWQDSPSPTLICYNSNLLACSSTVNKDESVVVGAKAYRCIDLGSGYKWEDTTTQSCFYVGPSSSTPLSCSSCSTGSTKVQTRIDGQPYTTSSYGTVYYAHCCANPSQCSDINGCYDTGDSNPSFTQYVCDNGNWKIGPVCSPTCPAGQSCTATNTCTCTSTAETRDIYNAGNSGTDWTTAVKDTRVSTACCNTVSQCADTTQCYSQGTPGGGAWACSRIVNRGSWIKCTSANVGKIDITKGLLCDGTRFVQCSTVGTVVTIGTQRYACTQSPAAQEWSPCGGAGQSICPT